MKMSAGATLSKQKQLKKNKRNTQRENNCSCNCYYLSINKVKVSEKLCKRGVRTHVYADALSFVRLSVLLQREEGNFKEDVQIANGSFR